MSEIITMDRKTLPWSVKQLVASMEKGTAVYDGAYQRSCVWDDSKKSLLIHSMIINAPIPPLYCVKNKEGKYEFLDGKQRSKAAYAFLNDELALVGVPSIVYNDGKEININGKVFSTLPEDMQDNIRTYSLSINVLDDMDEDEVCDIFFRLNNGADLRAVEKVRVKCPSIKNIQKIADHPLIRLNISDKAKERYADEDVVMKAFAMVQMDEPCLDNKVIREFVVNLQIDDKQEKEMLAILGKLNEVRDRMENAKSIKKVVGRTHLITLVGFMSKHMNDENQGLADFLDKFYNGTGRGTSISEVYNECCKGGTGHKENVRDRLKELESAYNS